MSFGGEFRYFCIIETDTTCAKGLAYTDMKCILLGRTYLGCIDMRPASVTLGMSVANTK